MLAEDTSPRITHGFKFDYTIQNVDCRLRFAAKYGYTDTICNLVTNHNAEVNSLDYNGYTPLVISILNGQTESTELLCQLGADVNYKIDKRHGYCALHLAAEQNQTKAIEVLLEHGAARDPQTFTGRTPLHLAALNGHHEAAKTLCLNGANVDTQEWYNGFTPLHYAILNNHGTITDLLLEFNAHFIPTTMNFSKLTKELQSYCEYIRTEPQFLEKICLDAIRKHFLWPNANKSALKLPLPTRIKRKILLQDL